jgi:hypothetical protein
LKPIKEADQKEIKANFAINKIKDNKLEESLPVNTTTPSNKDKGNKKNIFPPKRCFICNDDSIHHLHECPLINRAKQLAEDDTKVEGDEGKKDKGKKSMLIQKSDQTNDNHMNEDSRVRLGFMTKCNSTFGSYDVLLENQSAASIFTSTDPLTNIRKGKTLELSVSTKRMIT